MNNRELTSIEKRHLIEKYQSDARLLEHQLDKLHQWIKELENEPVEKKATVQPATPGKTETATKEKVEKVKKVAADKTKTLGKRGPKPKEKVKDSTAPVEVAAEKAAKIVVEKPKAVKAAKGTEKGAEKSAVGKIKIAKPAKAPKPAKVEKTSTAKKSKEAVPAADAAASEKKKPGRQATMSFWDTFVLDKLLEINKPMAVTDLLDAMKDERDAQKLNEGNTMLSQLLNRSLHKLYHKMQLISREEYDGRGYLYKTLGK